MSNEQLLALQAQMSTEIARRGVSTNQDVQAVADAPASLPIGQPVPGPSNQVSGSESDTEPEYDEYATESETDDDGNAAPAVDREGRIQRVLEIIRKSEERNQREAKLYNFDVERFVKRVEEISHRLQGKSAARDLVFRDMRELIAGGCTQTGKTAYKAALALLGKQCKFTTIIVTTV
eukprot:2256111-Rhodomonas_salina.1